MNHLNIFYVKKSIYFEHIHQVEAAMYAAVKVHLVKALEDSKLAKKDKWVKDNSGQCVIRQVLY